MRPLALAVLVAVCTVAAWPQQAQPVGENLVRNPGFEDGVGGWDERDAPITRDGNLRHEGDWSVRIDSSPQVPVPGFHYVRGEEIPAEPNVRYRFSVWLRGALTAGEARPRVREVAADGSTIRYHGNALLHPGERDWQRVEIEFVTDRHVAALQPYLITANATGPAWFDEVSLERLPLTPIDAAPGEAVAFGGSPGSLSMAVESTERSASGYRIVTTGSSWEIDWEAGTITGRQRIGADRQVITLSLQPAMQPLVVLRSDETACILRSPWLEIGVQADGLLVLAPQTATEVRAEGAIAGKWAQFADGNLQATDDAGGVCAFPYSPGGSGVVVGYDEPGVLTEPGWTAGWSLERGMLLGVSIYPPREFDWKRSFDWQLAHTGGYPSDAALETWSRYVKLVTLHESIWAGEQPTPHVGPYVPERPEELRRVIATCERLGMKLLVYMSPHYYVDQSIDAFMAQLASLREEFGFHGVFYDGVYFTDWVKSYEVMRRTREIFPDGPIYLHSSKGAPTGGYDLWCPFVDAYADITLRGEGRETTTEDGYVRYVSAGYGLSNAIGMMKGDRSDLPEEEQLRLMLGLNGRARLMVYPAGRDGRPVFLGEEGPLQGPWVDIYLPGLQQLREQWEAGTLER